jgi:hypothetical protein
MGKNTFWEALNLEQASIIHKTISERMTAEVKEPFLIEDFCAQVAWMLHCPVYPYGPDTNQPCEYLYKKGYENYRCPIARPPMTIFKPIMEHGTFKQKKALELLADMYVKYGTMENPPSEPNELCVGEAIQIYAALGLNKNASKLKKEFPIYRDL